MARPLLPKHIHNLLFTFGIDDVDVHRLILLEAVRAMYRLDKVLKLIVHSKENIIVTVLLEVAAAPSYLWFS